ncbi:MAG: hypothetical protein HXO49_02150 [Prevotella sp.]|nr:hypothetical protein [Prevotella sp.]
MKNKTIKKEINNLFGAAEVNVITAIDALTQAVIMDDIASGRKSRTMAEMMQEVWGKLTSLGAISMDNYFLGDKDGRKNTAAGGKTDKGADKSRS